MRQLTANWNLIRLIRLALGILIIVEGVRSQIVPLAVMGVAFSALALFNVGCGIGGCATAPPPSKQFGNKTVEVEYEEVNKK